LLKKYNPPEITTKTLKKIRTKETITRIAVNALVVNGMNVKNNPINNKQQAVPIENIPNNIFKGFDIKFLLFFFKYIKQFGLITIYFLFNFQIFK
jgi:hypothetical protein